MKRGIILFLFVLLASRLVAKTIQRDSSRWSTYVGFSGLPSWHQKAPAILNYPVFYTDRRALYAGSYFLHDKVRYFPLHSLAYALCFGLQFRKSGNGIISGQIRYSQIKNDGTGENLIFVDQFENPNFEYSPYTSFSNVRINYNYRMIGLGFTYMLEQQFGRNFHHRIGFKVNFDRVVNSIYRIRANYQEGKVDYYDRDIRFSDGVSILYPAFHYEVGLWQFKKRVFWLSVDYSQMVKLIPEKEIDSYTRQSTFGKDKFSMLSLGLKLEFQ